MTALGFRHDVNGLRAVAIIAVIGFHYQIPGFSGGFSGVDIFFVVSGFLMTAILFRQMDNGQIDLKRFYLARVRRILPALVTLCAVLLCVGAFVLDPLDFKNLGAEIMSSVAFLSNFLFVLGANQGYFAAKPETHWLLHTWSLSVEWQFYVFYPILFVILRGVKIGPKYYPIFLAGLATGSFALAEWIVLKHANPRQWYFFMLPNRGWEMLAGGLAACLARRHLRLTPVISKTLHYIGLVTLVACVCLTPQNVAWPSVATLPIVIATVAILVAGRADEAWSRFTPVNLLGRWSYSVYLCHWPLLAILAAVGMNLTPFYSAILFALAIGLGFLSYEVIEKRLAAFLFSQGRWKIQGGLATLAILCISFVCYSTTGLEALRTPEPARRSALREARVAMGDWSFRDKCVGGSRTLGALEQCQLGNAAATDVLVIGDSQAQQLIPRYDQLFRAHPSRGALFVTAGGCLPIRGVSKKNGYDTCGKKISQAMILAESGKYRRVVFVALWSGYIRAGGLQPNGGGICFQTGDQCVFYSGDAYQAHLSQALQAFSEDIAKLRQMGIEVTVCDVAPIGDEAAPLPFYKKVYFGGPLVPEPISRRQFDRATLGARELVLDAAHRGGAKIVVPADSLCYFDICPTHESGRLLYMDSAHFRASVVTEPRFGYLDSVILPYRSIS